MKPTPLKLAFSFLWCLLVGCAVPARQPAADRNTLTNQALGKIDFSKVPDANVKSFLDHMRRTCNETYPKILTILGSDPSRAPKQFNIVLEKPTFFSLFQRGDYIGGRTVGTNIYLNYYWVGWNPAHLDMVLVHEMAHVAQNYNWITSFRAPDYWREGMADYVHYKLGIGNGPYCAACSANYPHYRDGYWCAAAFLLYIDAQYGSNVIRQLNSELKGGTYTDAFFEKKTGVTVDMLWDAFRTTTTFTPPAAELLKLQETLGFVNGQPPRNVSSRFETFLREHDDVDEVQKAVGYERGKPPADVFARYAVYRYFKTPAGLLTQDGAAFLGQLRSQGELPGFSKEESQEQGFGLPEAGYSETSYPVSRTFSLEKYGKPYPYVFHYLIVRKSEEDAWVLQRAWRTYTDGYIAQEYDVSHD
jgi:hypothetical protein